MSRLPSLDYLRGVAALAVALPHYLMLGSTEWPAAKVVSILAVEQFFVLSGYVLAAQMLHCLQAPSHRDTGVFLVRRWMRTIPPYLAALAIVALLTANVRNPVFAAYALYVQNLFRPLAEAADFFPVAWSLSVEEWFYIVFAALLIFGRLCGLGRGGFILVAALFVAAITIARFAFGDMANWDAAVRRVVVFRMDSIAWGFLLYCFIDEARRRLDAAGKLLLPLFVVLSGVLAFYAGWQATAGKSAVWRHAYPFVSSGFALLTILALVHYDRAFRAKDAVAETGYFLGRISYTIYLFHLPIAMILRPLVAGAPLGVQLAIYTLSLFMFCVAFYHSFEAPILASRPHYRRSRDSRAEPLPSRLARMRSVLRRASIRRALLALFVLASCAAALAALERAQQLNSELGFYASLICATLLFAGFLKASSLWRFEGLQALGVALITFSVLLPIADRIAEWSRQRKPVASLAPAYSFRQAKADPEAFGRWWAEYADAWQKSAIPIQMRDPQGVLPFVMKPNSRSSFFGAPIEINNLGFRGKDIRREKGENYRIFVLGESPTFGTMISKQDATWVQSLEALIDSRLSCKRPVEVVNAGVAAYNIEHNIERLRRDILPLQPDMIVSYHGYNSYRLIDSDLDRLPTPPTRRKRGSLLISDLRFHFRLMAYDAALKRMLARRPTPYSNRHAGLYEEMAAIAKQHGIVPVFATLSLAVNDKSPGEVAEFYGRVFRPIGRILPAIAEHNRIVEEVARKTGAHFVDSRPGLDGEWDRDYFIDVVHFTHEGALKLAQNMFESIAPLLAKGAGCERRDGP